MSARSLSILPQQALDERLCSRGAPERVFNSSLKHHFLIEVGLGYLGTREFNPLARRQCRNEFCVLGPPCVLNIAVRTVPTDQFLGVSVRLAASDIMPVEKSLPVVGHVTTSTPVCDSFSADRVPAAWPSSKNRAACSTNR